MKSIKMVNEENHEFKLIELVEKSNSNPKIRRAELMVCIAGMEEYAKETGHIGVLYTITCPSRMHSSLSKCGNRNPKYDNTNPKQAQKYLNVLWSRIRANLNRKHIEVYGARVVEPHHDGTPHWHLLMFMEPQNQKLVTQLMRRYALQYSPSEPGAQERRLTSISIDWNKGTATGYVAKYISKNIDGFGVDKDRYNKKASESATRIRAWASTWGIRQFQFIGGPKVSIWRELRRLSVDNLPNNLIKECCSAADKSNWYKLMKLMGGHCIPNAKRTYKAT